MDVNILGGRHDLRLPLGALEEIARVEPRPALLLRRFGMGEWSLQELRAIWDAAIKWSPAPSLDFETLYEREKMSRLVAVAGELLLDAFETLPGDNPKKDEAPATETTTGATPS